MQRGMRALGTNDRVAPPHGGGARLVLPSHPHGIVSWVVSPAATPRGYRKPNDSFRHCPEHRL